MTGKRLRTFCSAIDTQHSTWPCIRGVHQYAYVPEQEKSIHSKCQFQAHGNLIGDTATVYCGLQRIDTSDGYQILLSIHSGLSCILQSDTS